MTAWNQGRPTVDALIGRGELERVPASQQAAEAELVRARTHVASARQLAATDPEGAYTLAYDAARRALAAVLQNQGLRATSRGGHSVIYEAVRAQLDPPLGSILRPFNRMRARRNEVEYRSSEAPTVTPGEVAADLVKVEALIELAEKAIPNMPRY
ncbi:MULTISPECIES: hypothetical protein [unclassified Streptomyces]|uniref:hypothetical protein n=1 Tax=unclassified Streptomyces TaxID=2593676 RepID=UPI001BE5468B|nr:MULTISPECIES: hypothetical protein [unclassified Streptomyces]MBT2407003.1 hypothetical protein [Streptomyces sp. ISL-21]MBT2613255.1 hypothetical protein [Streptomyces sp. ISL-87]